MTMLELLLCAAAVLMVLVLASAAVMMFAIAVERIGELQWNRKKRRGK